MKASRAKEIKKKVFEKMFNKWESFSYSDRKVLLGSPQFLKVYKQAKKDYKQS